VAARLRTKPSTRRLSEVARHVVIPEGIVSTGWPGVEAKCREWGDEFDRWQADLGRVILGKRADGLYAATVGGVTLSIPRQVAKTFLVGRIIFALCVLFPGLKVLWTAHHTATLGNTFRSLLGFTRRKSVAPYILATRRGSGKEAIEFANGSVIFFGARSQGFGRGFDEVDVEVFDEAQILDAKALEDMVAATNQTRHPHGALLFYMGTPPRPTDPGEEFADRRRKALAIKSDGQGVVEGGEAVYIECSADPETGHKGGPSLDSIEQLRKGNPSYPHRTPLASVKRLRANLKSDDSWRREGLGVWDDVEAGVVISPEFVESCFDVKSEIVSAPIFALDVSPAHSWAAIAVSGIRADGLPHIEITAVHGGAVDHQPGTDWVVPRMVQLAERWPDMKVAIASGSAAESLVPALQAVGIELIFIKGNDVAAACGLVFDLFMTKGLRHLGQQVLISALLTARKAVEDGEGAWRWGRKRSSADITPLYAATLALWVAIKGPDPEVSVFFFNDLDEDDESTEDNSY
jgi:hypothetical protein